MRLPRKPWFYASGVLAGGALLSAFDGKAASLLIWLEGWLAYSLLLGAALVSLEQLLAAYTAESSAPRRAAWTAFLLRLSVGVALIWLLPAFGYADNEGSQAGYLYKDAFRRDYQAIALARSDKLLTDAFSGTYQGDQYGGLLAFSAGVYRYLSPSAHRPLLIVLLAAWASGLGTGLLWVAAREWLGGASQGKIADSLLNFVPTAAAWIFSLYPESVLLGASQMREPFALFLIAAACFGLGKIKDGGEPGTSSDREFARKGAHGMGVAWAWLLGSLIGLFLLQPPVALAVMLVLSGMWLVDALAHRYFSWKMLGLLAGALVLGLVVVTLLLTNLPSLQGYGGVSVLFTWLANNFGFQTYLTARTSGMVQYIISVLGEQWLLPVVLIFGFAQPVLPAVLVEPSQPIWMVIGALRALGWYLLAPLLIYGAVTVFHPAPQLRRALRLWLTLAAFAWILIAAANAGGDFWDNPRYRTIFLPWLALLAAWALWWAVQRRDAWLWRWLAVEVVFVLFFLWWYISRYYPSGNDGINLSIWLTSGLTLGAAGLILVGGWLWDRVRPRNGQRK